MFAVGQQVVDAVAPELAAELLVLRKVARRTPGLQVEQIDAAAVDPRQQFVAAHRPDHADRAGGNVPQPRSPGLAPCREVPQPQSRTESPRPEQPAPAIVIDRRHVVLRQYAFTVGKECAARQQENALIPADLETGETIKTPRGTFYVTAMSREQMEAAGYGLHHQSDDGKYLIMGNGTRAFAVPVQPENYLKAAEQTTEQNYNMIDGQINNTPTAAELEEKAKAGGQISLAEYAEALKTDKERGKPAKQEKPSIRAQLKAAKEQTPKKQARQKTQDLERS